MFSLYLKYCQAKGAAAAKLNVFLQLTPEMQTHLPQPLNRISFWYQQQEEDGGSGPGPGPGIDVGPETQQQNAVATDASSVLPAVDSRNQSRKPSPRISNISVKIRIKFGPFSFYFFNLVLNKFELGSSGT
ncbi:uncharacterized protein LOC117193852 [Drosophila miranda]|uniref:uncharacterized protein LOC117193852 n=1 Tax=Drosophila miranda TaxID=7229 RepID=UPI00143F0B04|nr:uncharacterized protein LOC117193852 [Drosophila miranda]